MGTAGVILNARVGDPAYGWAADHVEPAVSIRNREDGPEHALHYLACIGNTAIMTSGEAKGARGVVTGEHAHILIDFEPEVLEQICIGDQVLIRAVGMGLEMLDYPDISVRKMSPELFDALRIEELGDGRIRVPVAAEIPGYLMGSGAELGRRLRRPGHDDQRPRDAGRTRARPICASATSWPCATTTTPRIAATAKARSPSASSTTPIRS